MKRIIVINYPNHLSSEAKALKKEVNAVFQDTSSETHAIVVPKGITINEFLVRSRDEILEELEIVSRPYEDEEDEATRNFFPSKNYN